MSVQQLALLFYGSMFYALADLAMGLRYGWSVALMGLVFFMSGLLIGWWIAREER